MSDRFAYLYGPVNTFAIRTLVNELSLRGITLPNPANGRVTALSEDGDQIDVTLDIIEAAVSNHDLLTFQLWMPAHADVCCRIRHLGHNRLVEEYSLFGLHPEERNHVVNVLVDRFKAKGQREEGLFLVGDPQGYTIDADWDELSLAGKYELRMCPDVLGIPLDRLVDFELCQAINHNSARIGTYLILSSTLNVT